MRVQNKSLIDSPVALTTSWQSEPIWLEHIICWSLQLIFTGSPSGTFVIQVSNDPLSYEDVKNGAKTIGNWSDYTGSTSIITAAGDLFFNIKDAGYKWARVKYVFTAGTGSLTVATFQVKGA